ncbi:hypothetical protein J6590_039549 [Homalodisca vitripennis]|nr:hypothetical protein J6590_039549 [Homalodisca vitripennis]
MFFGQFYRNPGPQGDEPASLHLCGGRGREITGTCRISFPGPAKLRTYQNSESLKSDQYEGCSELVYLTKMWRDRRNASDCTEPNAKLRQTKRGAS